MKLIANNLVSQDGSETITFVVWSKQGTGMVNVFGKGGSGGEMLSIEAARKYWKTMVAKWGYKKAPQTTIEPC